MRKIITIVIIASAFVLQAQTPGGITGVQGWIKSERVQTTTKFHWSDYSGDSIRVNEYGVGEEYATDKVKYFNFNPAVYVGPTKRKKTFLSEFILPFTGLNQATVLGVHTPITNFTEESFMYGVNGRPKNGFLMTTDKVVASTESGLEPLDYGSEIGRDFTYVEGEEPLEKSEKNFKETITRVLTYQRYTPPNNNTVWGERREATVSLGGAFIKDNPTNTSTFDETTFVNNAFQGYVPEMILYDRVLTPNERVRVETYLALKYGLTLDKSYISSWNATLWNLESYPSYNHRITGVVRDNLSGLYQPLSTTSYESMTKEGYFSYQTGSYDCMSYDKESIDYALPTRYRLLTLGLEPTSELLQEDKKYAIWGDNDKKVTTRATKWLAGMRMIPRIWKMNADLPKVDLSTTKVTWTTKDLEVVGGNWKNDFTKHDTVPAHCGTAVLDKPLKEKEGILRWEFSTTKGYAVVKFGTKQDTLSRGSHDYGIYMKPNGVLYTVYKGEISNYLDRVSEGDALEMIKSDSIIRFRKNGKIVENQLKIAKEDREKTYYAALNLQNYGYCDMTLSNFYHRGFVEDGMQVELSYKEGAADEFNPARVKDGYNLYMLIDKTGKGDFSKPENLSYVSHGIFDKHRSKVVFNNLFLDQDQSGKEAFTFGYKRKTSLLAFIKETRPTCKIDSTSNADGKLYVKIAEGSGTYQYQLTGINNTKYTGEVVTVSANEFTIIGIAEGDYALKIKDVSGKYYDIVKNQYIRAECHEEVPYPDGDDTGNGPGTGGVNDDPRILVYPVPVRAGQTFRIRVTLDSPDKMVYYFYNASGKEVLRHNTGTARVHNLRAGLYTPGVYIFKAVTRGGDVLTKKIIVN